MVSRSASVSRLRRRASNASSRRVSAFGSSDGAVKRTARSSSDSLSSTNFSVASFDMQTELACHVGQDKHGAPSCWILDASLRG